MDWYYVNGAIDDVRVYNYALPHGEIVTLAEQEPAAYHPVTSAANIYDEEAKLSKKVNFADFAILAPRRSTSPTSPSWRTIGSKGRYYGRKWRWKRLIELVFLV
jgi:hypothetical protein